MFDITGLDALKKNINSAIQRTERKAESAMKQAAEDFVEQMMKNIPVWSGRTVSSIMIGDTPQYAALKGDPPTSEWFRFGRTSQQKLGAEAMRAGAEAEVRGRLSAMRYSINKSVFITVHSEAWGLVEVGKAPDGKRARNQAVVSAIALAYVRSAHPIVK